MNHIKLFEEFNWFGLKDKKEDPNKDIIKKNEEVLKKIFDLGELVHNEGEFKPTSRLSKSGVIDTDKNSPFYQPNDLVITDYGGISCEQDIVTNIYKLSIPVKFKGSFKYEILSLIKKDYNVSSYKDTGYTMVIKFTDK